MTEFEPIEAKAETARAARREPDETPRAASASDEAARRRQVAMSRWENEGGSLASPNAGPPA